MCKWGDMVNATTRSMKHAKNVNEDMIDAMQYAIMAIRDEFNKKIRGCLVVKEEVAHDALCRYCGKPIRGLNNAPEIWTHALPHDDQKRTCWIRGVDAGTEMAEPVPEGCVGVWEESTCK